MNICSKCGQEMGADARFCKACSNGLPAAGSGGLGRKKTRVMAAERNWLKISALIVASAFIGIAAWAALSVYGKMQEATLMRAPVQAHADQQHAVQYTLVRQEQVSVKIPLSQLDGLNARFYVYPAAGKEIKFFLLRMPDGSVRAALDACNACYHAKRGYREDGDQFVCNNCGMSFRKEDIGIVTGGCNPIPVPRNTDGQYVIVKVKDLEAGAKYF